MATLESWWSEDGTSRSVAVLSTHAKKKVDFHVAIEAVFLMVIDRRSSVPKISSD